MNEFLTRIFSGVLYAFLIIFSLVVSDFFFATIILIFTLLALIEFQKIISFINPFPSILLIAVFNFFLLNNFNYYINTSILICTLLMNIYLTYDLFNNNLSPIKKFQKLFLAIFYMAGSSYFIILTQRLFSEFSYWITIYFFSIIWINNSFAYIIGKNLGRNPLYKNISPKKTWEGFLGGLIFSILASIFYYTLQSSFHFLVFVFSGIILPILATIGDLIQSKFKRRDKNQDSFIRNKN